MSQLQEQADLARKSMKQWLTQTAAGRVWRQLLEAHVMMADEVKQRGEDTATTGELNIRKVAELLSVSPQAAATAWSRSQHVVCTKRLRLQALLLEQVRELMKEQQVKNLRREKKSS